jgi:hypothetical protein
MARAPALAIALLVGLSFAAPAAAQRYAARDLGAWTVTVSEDGQGCFVTRSYDRDGDTTLLLGIDIDGSHRLSVLNANWSIRRGERWMLDFRLSNGGYANQAVVGMAADDRQGFVTSFDARFPTRFAASKALSIARGKVPVERLSLDGSGAAVVELRRCVSLLKAQPAPAARETRRADRIPKDPFARDRVPRSEE